jgi:hypothetical protein
MLSITDEFMSEIALTQYRAPIRLSAVAKMLPAVIPSASRCVIIATSLPSSTLVLNFSQKCLSASVSLSLI